MIECLCPTYGRTTLLGRSIAGFLRQTFYKSRLIVLNDAPVPIEFVHPRVTVVNVKERYGTLGEKRQALLEMSSAEYVSHWDDDDVYLPWFLEEQMGYLRSGHKFVKPVASMWFSGSSLRPPARNIMEGSVSFCRKSALELGGYENVQSGQCLRMLNAASSHGIYKHYDAYPVSGYIMCWSGTPRHVSTRKDFASNNKDFGPVRIQDLSNIFRIIAEQSKSFLDKDRHSALLSRLSS